ncbi:HpcH/HpaI aldolase/citrate lyase family protein [Variovorax sp. VNK109]|uniref:HpcH/HpaI aldolase/citrate lyase family protein n=1 Tax=Variovorax sp. VNK109 TaxID=3400919 RepID=UPI003C2E9236
MSLERSLLFVPGNRPERFQKAFQSATDAVIFDLEDAVPPGEKEFAREQVANALNAQQPAIVRINAAGSAWFSADLELLSLPGVAAIMLPKAESIDPIKMLERVGCSRIFALIETAEGLANARLLARCRPVSRLAFGSLDFQADLRIDGDDDELLMYRSELVLASRLAGLPGPIDGVTVALDDPVRLAADASRSARLGFEGKLCIHPKQVQVVNSAYSPSQEVVAWARRVVTAVQESGGDVVVLDGKMVDAPVVLRAQAIVRTAEQLAGRA